MRMASGRQFAIVTGASSGIGRELARECAKGGFDLLIAADEEGLESAAEEYRALGAKVDTCCVDLSTEDGVDRLITATNGRPVEALLANAGHGLGHAFLDQDFDQARHVLDTNVTGTIYLIRQIGEQMRMHGHGRILITASVAAFMPGPFAAVYNGTKAFLHSFSHALREELKDSGVTVTCLIPGATETGIFERAGMEDTKVATDEKMQPEEVARYGFEAMMKGDAQVIAGAMNRINAAAAHMAPAESSANTHRKQAAPGTAEKH
jgi:short-subunit dehydrogenase